MSPKINSCKHIGGILQYHEQKVELGNALCLYAGNFIKDAERLTMADKLYGFERYTSLNDRATKPVLHVLLNFHPSEVVSDHRMREVSQDFMVKWGRGDIPYLVYRHSDRVQPHVHIVGTVVGNDGKLNRLMYDDIIQAREVTRELVDKWSLVPSISRKDWVWEPPGPAMPIDPAEMSLYPAMRNVFAHVIEGYLYGSLEELNVLLRPYNIEAYGGSQDSFLHEKRGLIYRVLDDHGSATGTYIRACDFSSKPTLKRLEERFDRNRDLRESHREYLTSTIDWAFYQKSPSLDGFKKAMAEEKIGVRIEKDEQGVARKIWYVDHLNKAVFEGGTLGESYKAEVIAGRCAVSDEVSQSQKQELKVRPRLDL